MGHKAESNICLQKIGGSFRFSVFPLLSHKPGLQPCFEKINQEHGYHLQGDLEFSAGQVDQTCCWTHWQGGDTGLLNLILSLSFRLLFQQKHLSVGLCFSNSLPPFLHINSCFLPCCQRNQQKGRNLHTNSAIHMLHGEEKPIFVYSGSEASGHFWAYQGKAAVPSPGSSGASLAGGPGRKSRHPSKNQKAQVLGM